MELQHSRGGKSTELLFLLDPLESLYGPIKPAFLMAMENQKNFDAVFVSQLVDVEVAELLKALGFGVQKFSKHFLLKGSLLTLEAWLRKSSVEIEPRNRLIVNFSQCFLANAHIYYAQGPMSRALSEMYPEMRRAHRFAYSLVGNFLSKSDVEFIRKLREKSQFFVANSNFCASMYEDLGVQVDDVIYPPLDCDQFQPMTSQPSRDYVLTYFGKETKYASIKSIADKGVKIKSFGSKEPYVPGYIRRHPNIDFMADVSDLELANLYSNALFTLYTFNHEPFGYIPVESAACGTPVLTYDRQGPGESMINDKTGWLVESDDELIEKALELWKFGCPKSFDKNCRARALEFDSKIVAKKWLRLIDRVEIGRAEWAPSLVPQMS